MSSSRAPGPRRRRKTNANGNYSIKFTPGSTGSYQVSTGQISQIEIPTLNPAVRRHPLAGRDAAVQVKVKARSAGWAKSSAAAHGRRAVAPGTGHANATSRSCAPPGSKALPAGRGDKLGANDGNFAAR